MKKHSQSDIAERSVKKEYSIRGLAGKSLIIFLIDRLSEIVHKTFINGFFGFIFSAYSDELCAYENGYFLDYFKGNKRNSSFFRKIREYLSRNFETSFILKKLKQKVCGLAFVPLKAYGSFFLAFGIYTIIVYFIKNFLPIMGTADIEYFYIGFSICIASLPLYFSRQSLAKAVKQSKITNAIFVDVFGYRDEAFENKNYNKSKRTSVAILWGLIAGILTFVINPIQLLVVMAAFIIFSLIIISPEIGILLCIFGLPFMSFASNPTFLLSIFVIVTALSYLIKIVRGKRIFRLELIDFAVMLFLIIIFFSGAITVGGKESYYSALISCIFLLGYFLVVNLIRTEEWLKRCIMTLVSSSVVVAIIGVGQYVLGLSVNDWLDTTYFTGISGRTTSLFENPNYLAAYLALVFPFALYLTFVAKSKKERLLLLISDIMIVLCAVFTWSRGAWIAMLVSGILLCIIYTRKTMRLIWCAIASIPFFPFILPDNLISRFMSIGDLADSSTMYRVYTWKGSLAMIKDYFWSGIGYGTEAFSEVYPVYAYSGMETAVHSHSLYLQIFIGMGIGGIIAFSLIILFFTQKSFGYFKAPASRDSFMRASASLIAIFALLIMGVFDYVWYNYRVFFLFWVVMALGVACIKMGNREILRVQTVADCNEYSATTDIIL